MMTKEELNKILHRTEWVERFSAKFVRRLVKEIMELKRKVAEMEAKS